MSVNKKRVIKDFDSLPEKLQEQIKLAYPAGFLGHLVSFVNRDGEKKWALPFETDDYYYLVRMNIKVAKEIVENDNDYDENGMLKDDVKGEYQEKYEDVGYMSYNANEDNDIVDDSSLDY